MDCVFKPDGPLSKREEYRSAGREEMRLAARYGTKIKTLLTRACSNIVQLTDLNAHPSQNREQWGTRKDKGVEP